MKNQADYSIYECPYSHIPKECGHELKGPEGYEDTFGVWCACGFRGPVFCLDPIELSLNTRGTEMKQTTPEMSTLAARVLKTGEATPEEIKSLAACVLSQDETPGQEDKPVTVMVPVEVPRSANFVRHSGGSLPIIFFVTRNPGSVTVADWLEGLERKE